MFAIANKMPLVLNVRPGLGNSILDPRILGSLVSSRYNVLLCSPSEFASVLFYPSPSPRLSPTDFVRPLRPRKPKSSRPLPSTSCPSSELYATVDIRSALCQKNDSTHWPLLSSIFLRLSHGSLIYPLGETDAAEFMLPHLKWLETLQLPVNGTDVFVSERTCEVEIFLHYPP